MKTYCLKYDRPPMNYCGIIPLMPRLSSGAGSATGGVTEKYEMRFVRNTVTRQREGDN
jgi:hypothetical protein